jgi:hypothetical protein
VVHDSGSRPKWLTGEGDLIVVVAVGSRFRKERGDGGKLVDVEVVWHHGWRCLAMVSSQRWAKRMASALGAVLSWPVTARG